MESVLRHCVRCHLYFESTNRCPVCGHDTAKPQVESSQPDRRKTTEVPRQPLPPTK